MYFSFLLINYFNAYIVEEKELYPEDFGKDCCKDCDEIEM